MLSKVEICNIALDNFGCSRITSMEEDTEQARILRNMYDLCRQSLLAKGCWNFATGYDDLNRVVDKTLYHPRYHEIYVYPSDVIKIVKIFTCDIDYADRYYNPEYEIMNKKNRLYIATDVRGAKAKVIRDIENTAMYPPEFVTCLSYLIATRVSEALTRNAQIVQEMEAKYVTTLNEAMLTNAVESNVRTQYPDGFYRFRTAGGRRYR